MFCVFILNIINLSHSKHEDVEGNSFLISSGSGSDLHCCLRGLIITTVTIRMYYFVTLASSKELNGPLQLTARWQ